jgi:3',5'-nucleoside bisphosphate phosphatase
VNTSTSHLVLNSDAAVDLQVHTHYSDGTWTPEALIDHLRGEGFALAAITDHDRVDTTASLQHLAQQKGLPLLVAVEMTTLWKGEMTDVLCYGFDPENNELNALAQDVLRRQQDNTRQIFDNLRQKSITFPVDEMTTVLEKPSAQQPHDLVALVKKHGYGTPEVSAGKLVMEAGFAFMMNDIAAVVEAGHRSGAVCLIAHPGRGGENTQFDAAWFDDLRREIPIDGLEVYYSTHTPEQTAMYVEYARKHGLLMSSGSDSHHADKPPAPIKYRAELSRSLLERLGITIRG